MSQIAAIMLAAFLQSATSNGDNANQIRASIYEIVTENTFRTVRPLAQQPAARAERVRRARRR